MKTFINEDDKKYVKSEILSSMKSLENIQYYNDINPKKMLEILDELNEMKKTKEEIMPILLELGLFIIQRRPMQTLPDANPDNLIPNQSVGS